jgi:hypothetical protein
VRRGGALQNGFDALAADDMKESKRWACRALRATFQLRKVTGRDVQQAGKNCLAHLRLFAQCADFIRGKQSRLRRSLVA